MLLFSIAFSCAVVSRAYAIDPLPLYNGVHKSVFSPNISARCDTVLRLDMNCPELIQLTPYPIQTINWNTSSLTTLCTPDCNSSMALETALAQRYCVNDTFVVDNTPMSLADLVSLMWYKWDLICLKDENTQDFCLDVEDSWNITTMVAEASATWPNNTQKCYLDRDQGYWQWYTDANGTCIDPPWLITELDSVYETSGLSDMSALDYYNVAPDPVEDDNYGWPEMLDFDEYPLEIQCSSCFLQKFKHAYEHDLGSSWESVSRSSPRKVYANDRYSEITEQVWANMKRNCALDYDIVPVHNVSGVINIGESFEEPGPVTTNCPQNITISADESFTCLEVGPKFRIATSGLNNLNGILDCAALTNITICAPLSCPIMVVDLHPDQFSDQTMGTSEFVDKYTNLTLAEFYAYNFYQSRDFVTQNETVCVGPAIEIYLPSS